MENYIVSARKYRPSTFESVVGQRALTTTLKNAIATGKLAHAYLFCGPRGVGKTTCARIFAKTINCQNLTAEHEGDAADVGTQGERPRVCGVRLHPQVDSIQTRLDGHRNSEILSVEQDVLQLWTRSREA